MQRESLESKRMWAWLAAAMSAPLAHFAGGSWLALLFIGLLCGGLLAMLPSRSTILSSKLLCLLELAWIVVLLSQFAPLCAPYWPGEKSEYVVPAALLFLGAYGCSKRAERVAGVIFLLLAALYVPILIVGVKDMKVEWLAPKSMNASLWLVPALLLPACASFLPADNRAGNKWYPAIIAWGLVQFLLTVGVLSPAVAAQTQTPFRELGRTLTIGTASRFEALLSVSITLGWFSLISLLIQCGSAFVQSLGAKEKWCPWIVAIASVLPVWTGVQLSGTFGAVFSLFLWILIPMLHGKIFSKKREKNT